jgi:hypothetical protein
MKHDLNYDSNSLCLIKYNGEKNAGKSEEKDNYEALDLDTG